MRPRPVCLYIVGQPPSPVYAEHGDFSAWFHRLLDAVDVAVVDGRGSAAPPDPRDYAGIVISGSAASLTAPEPWMESAIELIREAAQIGSPVLGVCFGHQLIGAAYCGSVIENPAGWELASYEVSVTAAGRQDLLFDGLPETIHVNLSHRDIVDPDTLAPANGITVLAHSERTAVQAMAAGDCLRGVQFHPEFTGEITRSYQRTRATDLAADARNREADHDHPDRLAERTRDCPDADLVFSNWVRHFALRS